MFDPHAYTITVRRLRVDEEELFRATVAEFPDVEPYAPTFAEAYELAIDAIETLHSAYEEEGREFPVPATEEPEFSGRVTLRIPRSVHRSASMIATSEGVSLNQWLASVVSYAVGFGGAGASANLTGWNLTKLATASVESGYVALSSGVVTTGLSFIASVPSPPRLIDPDIFALNKLAFSGHPSTAPKTGSQTSQSKRVGNPPRKASQE